MEIIKGNIVNNFIKDKDFYFLNLGHDFISNSPKRIIPVSRDEN